MRLCRFQHDGKTAFGIIDDADAVTVIKGSPFENYAVTGETHALSERQAAGAHGSADLLCRGGQLP